MPPPPASIRTLIVKKDNGDGTYEIADQYYDDGDEDEGEAASWKEYEGREGDLDATIKGIVFAVGDQVSAYWDIQRGMYIPILNEQKILWQGFVRYNVEILSTSPQRIPLVEMKNTAPSIFSVEDGALIIAKAGLIEVSYKANLDRPANPGAPFVMSAAVWIDVDGVDVPKSRYDEKWALYSAGTHDRKTASCPGVAVEVSSEAELRLEAAHGDESMLNYTILGGNVNDYFGTVVTVRI